MTNYMVKITFFIINLWHTRVWLPFCLKLLKYKLGRIFLDILHLLFGSLVILNIIAPAPGEIPCLIHLFIRTKNRRINFSKRIRYLLKFWRIK